MTKLPKEFLKWNYYSRRKLLEELLEGEISAGPKLFLEFTRHTPILCTAAVNNQGEIEVNGKVVGVGYVLKREYLNDAIREFKKHVSASDEVYRKVKNDPTQVRSLREKHAMKGVKLLLKYIYLEELEAEKRVDFEKLTTIEMAKRLPNSSKHTWNILQRSRKACLVFYQPPAISYELRGYITIHTNDEYHEFVNLVHDAYHYTPPEKRSDRPVYLFHVDEVYDNSATQAGFGRKIG